MPLLEAQDVSRSFGSTRALVDLSLSIDKGEIVALMGANGAGKSTFVKILSGLISADGGTIRFKGQPYVVTSPAQATAAGIVTVHQSTDLVGIPGLTVGDALLLNRFVDRRQPFFVSKRGVRRQAQAILKDAGFDLPVDRDFAELSPADRQLVAIARALANKAELLILDEPTASLSSVEANRLYGTLLELKRRGIAILYISHRTADLEALADRVVVLRGGKVASTFQRPIDFPAAIETMIGRPLASARPDARDIDGPPVLRITNAQLFAGSEPFDLSLRRGEVVAITGVLGAGKSRFLSAIFGNGRLAAGSMTLDGHPFQPRNPSEAIAAGVAMAGEDRHRSSLMPAGWPGESIAATISMPHLGRWFPHGMIDRGLERRRAADAISRIGIRASGPAASVWTLSGGNQQKVVLGRWEVEPGKVLLLDEPFQGVDVVARHDIIAAIRAQTDRATLIATSDPEEAIEVADRVLVMDHHTIRAGAPGAKRQKEPSA